MSKMSTFAAAAVLALAAPLAAQAGEVSAANIGFNYSTLADGNARQYNKATLGGSMSIAFSPAFSMQGDASFSHLGSTDWNPGTAMVHAIWTPNDTFALGGFTGVERMDGSNITSYGVEAGQNYGAFNYEGYLYRLDGDGENGTGLGLRGMTAFGGNLAVGGRVDLLNTDTNLRRYGVLADYSFAPGYSVTGELGYVDVEHADAESYVSFGIRADFGARGGQRFSTHSLTDLLPGL